MPAIEAIEIVEDPKKKVVQITAARKELGGKRLDRPNFDLHEQTYGTGKESREEVLRLARNALDICSADLAWQENRERALESFRFYDGDQWDEEVRSFREAEGRPCLTINKTRKFVQQVVGEYRKNILSIKVRPVDGKSDPAVAKVREGLIRTIEYASYAPQFVYQKALEHAVIGGWGAWRVAVEWPDDEVDAAEIRIRLIHNPLSLYIDPASRQYDLSDARFVLLTQYVDEEWFKKKFPGKATTDFDGSLGDRAYQWYNTQENKIRIAEMWWYEDYIRDLVLIVDDLGNKETVDLSEEPDKEWVKFLEDNGYIVKRRKAKSRRLKYALVSGSEVLWGPKPWPGKYYPFVVTFGDETVVDGLRKLQGLVYSMMDPQRMYNIWRSYTAEILALQPKAPWVGPKGFTGTGNQRKAWEQSHRVTIPVLEYDGPTPPQRQPPPTYPSGLDREALNCTQDLKETSGIFDASLGAQGNETSGKAILARQMQAQSSIATFLENHRFAIAHTGRIINDLIPYVYDTPRVIRILGDDAFSQKPENHQLVPINGETLPGPDGQPIPSVNLKAGKYDIVTTVGPSYVTSRLEAFDAMKDILQVLGPELSTLIVDKMIEYGGFPGADEIAQTIRDYRLQGGPQLSPQVQQQIMQMIQQVAPSPQAILGLVRSEIGKALSGQSPGGNEGAPPPVPGPVPGPGGATPGA